MITGEKSGGASSVVDKTTRDEAMRQAVDGGYVLQKPGAHGAKLHSLTKKGRALLNREQGS